MAKPQCTVVCATCGRSFAVKPYRVGVARYCTTKCRGVGSRKSGNERPLEVILADERTRQEFMGYVHHEPNSGCWLWGGSHRYGYGRFWVVDRHLLAHRLSWIFAGNEIPEGLCVLHRCDIPACVNPDHLFLGTQGANGRDMAKKNRGRKSLVGLPFGVCRNGKKFMATVWDPTFGTRYVGIFATAEEANAAAVRAKQRVMETT